MAVKASYMGRPEMRGTRDVPAEERGNWNVAHPAPYLDQKGRGNKSMVHKDWRSLNPTGQRSLRRGVYGQG